MAIKDGDEVTFMSGSGWEADAHVGVAMGVTARDATVRYETNGRPMAKVVPLSRIVGRPIRWNGRESAMDYLCRVEEALREQGVGPKAPDGETSHVLSASPNEMVRCKNCRAFANAGMR